RADGTDFLVGVEDLLGREPLPRHHLEDRPRRAHPHALPAPRAPGLVRVTVRAHNDLRMLAALADVEHADHLYVLARPHAARAQDTGAHVVTDHGVARALVTVAEHQVTRRDGAGSDPVAHHVLFELVARPGPAAVQQVLARVAPEQEPQHTLA